MMLQNHDEFMDDLSCVYQNGIGGYPKRIPSATVSIRFIFGFVCVNDGGYD